MKIFLILIYCFAFITYSFGQPETILIMKTGYLLPVGDLKGNYNDSLSIYKEGEDEGSYFIKNGYGFGLDLKFSLNKAKTLKFVTSLEYNVLQNSKDYKKDDIVVEAENKINIMTITPTIEYMFMTKKSKINPFAGAGVTLNLFSGQETVTYPDSTDENILDPAIRIGVSTYAGIDYRYALRLGFNAGVKYNITNVIGKSSGTDSKDTYNLNDAEGTVNNIPFKSRSIQYLLIFAGVSIYLGI